MKIKKITIVGLGLIGGSLAKALRRTNPDFYIVAVDVNEADLEKAMAQGVIDHKTCELDHIAIGSDLIFLCTPIDTIKDLLKALSSRVKSGTIITDTASVKGKIMDLAKDLLPDHVHFIGGHPMSGTEQSGYDASIAHLFENAYYMLTPQEKVSKEELDTLTQLVASTGALPLIISAKDHDEKVGAVSHLPHAAAAALVNTVQRLDGEDHLASRLAAGGFKDITRIASSNPKMWSQISLANKGQLLGLVKSLIKDLSSFCHVLSQDDQLGLEDFFSRAKAYRDDVPAMKSLYLLPFYELYVDVEDKPGMISLVTTILGHSDINIKNIRVINSREDEPGCLVLSLDDKRSVEKAQSLLKGVGLKANVR